MRVTSKGQVTIPLRIRRLLGIRAGSEVEFTEEEGRVYVSRKVVTDEVRETVGRYRGSADAGLSTEEILALTREHGE
jgi:AbrB family looped-hinge helix DNA binding protein